MLPPGVLHMSALGCFGRFTLFSPRVSHSNTCRPLSFVCFVFLFGFGFCCVLVPVLQVSRNLWICIGETWGVFTLGDTRK